MNEQLEKIKCLARSKFGLRVPFVRQSHENSCGPAVLEMTARYLGNQTINEMEVFNQFHKQNPDSPQDLWITTSDLVEAARMNGFPNSFWSRVNLDDELSDIANHLQEFISNGEPIIVNQQFTADKPHIGHFRLVYRISERMVSFHDPYADQHIQWPLQRFIDYWRPNGNVTGGIYIILRK